MPNGFFALTLPPAFLSFPESLSPPAHAASVPLNGMTAAVASAPFMKLRRSTAFFSVVMVPAFRGEALEEQSGRTTDSPGVPGFEAAVVLVPAGDVGRQVDRRSLARVGQPSDDF